ncbi:hypothetical protein PSEUDO8O_31040 [Pseudomonas sp. 8O]|nr:hypothetical protein PSEUDO8O_31040 [Pseudomonas sp. 8O]
MRIIMGKVRYVFKKILNGAQSCSFKKNLRPVQGDLCIKKILKETLYIFSCPVDVRRPDQL